MKYDLFPTLIKEYDVRGYPQKEQLLKSIFEHPAGPHSAVNNGISSYSFKHKIKDKELNFLTLKGFNDLNEYFYECSTDYSQEIGISPGKINNIWFNIMDHEGQTLRHHHPGSTIAGAYYPLLENNSCNLIFYSPIYNFQQTWFDKISYKSNKQTKYSTSEFSFPIKQDHLYLFPGWLDHGTEVNKSNKRVVISFNVIPWVA